MNDSNDTLPEQNETLIEFPCEFPLKIMGSNHKNFIDMMCDLVSTHINHTLDKKKITHRPSTSGKYVAVTITFTAENKQQIDNIYQALYEHDDVKMTL